MTKKEWASAIINRLARASDNNHEFFAGGQVIQVDDEHLKVICPRGILIMKLENVENFKEGE